MGFVTSGAEASSARERQLQDQQKKEELRELDKQALNEQSFFKKLTGAGDVTSSSSRMVNMKVSESAAEVGRILEQEGFQSSYTPGNPWINFWKDGVDCTIRGNSNSTGGATMDVRAGSTVAEIRLDGFPEKR